ncbi:PREDICTED: uncharacterized protein LOC109470470 isoform X1 [Branchiostoma belcheri]|uniref:Uncharacterized protein LOC109470470 isoform X1 n=1 Tax=Branchiostoma belcheri TaxID=7741 RepID=A0A6P4Z1N6_BRABE|nr:PREDICTED: uncharacterized protein LOC109470470 isoform X1 [Branchiostoma belcheri]
MKNMYLLAFFSLVFLGLCSSGVTGDTVSGKELEALRILHRLSVALKNNGGGIGDAKGGKPDVYDGGPDDDTDEETEDTEGTNLVTEDADGDTEGTDGDTEGTDGDADGDTEDTNGDSEGTDGFTEDADGDAEGTDTVTGDADGDAEGTDGDTGGTDGDTGDANGDAEGTDGDAGGDAGDADGDAGDADRDAGDADGDAGDADRDAGDADGDTEGTNGDTGDADGDTEGTNGDTGDADGDAEGTDADVSSTRATEKRGQDAEDLENLVRTSIEMKRGRSAGADELSFQSRRQNSDPCNSYRVLNQPWRSVDIPGYKGKCDNGFNGEWYRFMSPAGTSMPTQPPPTDYRCGTHAPIWMNGQHPSVADGEVSRQTCALWGSNPCVAGWTSPIRVKACSAGYYVYKLPGVRCHLTYCATDFQDVCFPSPCENGDCVVAANNYTCNCRSGFEGGRCERDIDGCSPNPCDAEATCADIPAPGIGANCTCRSGFVGDGRSSGSRCTRAVVPGEKIIFPGPRDVDDYARMETTLSGDLTSFTLCVHMRSNMASSNQISLVSYALSQHNNELLLFVNGGFQLYIQSDIRMADPPVWDGEWHTVCTTWRSRDGAWQFYVDGDLTASGSGFRVGGRVRRGGTWILGQDQDRVGGGFEASQSFIGELSEVNLWDRVLSSAEIAADCSYHGNVIDWETTNIRVFGEASKAEYHRCARARAPVSELSASTTCSNDYMELSIPEDQLTDIDLNNLHWRPDRNCGATTNGSHYLFRTELYDCGTEVTFGAKYVTFLNTINILGTHLNSGVITREGDIWITSKCNYERKEWVDSTFLPIPGGLNFTEEGFGQLEVRLSMFPTRQYQRQYRADQYPIHLRLRQHVYMQLEVQGHAQKLSVLALNCKATMSPSPNDSLQYQLIRDGCASDPTLKTYDVDDPGKERFGFEAFRFIREVRTVYVHCEVLVCDAADAGSRCAQGCVRRGKRAAGEVDMRGRHMIYQGPIVLDDYKEAEHAVRLVDDQETGPARRGAPWAMLAAGCVLAALALVVLGTAIVQKRSRRGEWAYHGLKDRE